MDVVAGTCADEHISIETFGSFARMCEVHHEFNSRLLGVKGGCADLAGNRNRLIRLFLSSGVEWLLTFDSDIVWTPEDWARLRDSALKHDVKFVAGTYMVANQPPEPCAVVVKDGRFYSLALTEDSPEMYQVSACGAGFTLIHREVFLATADPGNDHEWYEHGRRGPAGQTLPEDYAFCSRVGEAGIPIWLNTKVRLGHVKSRIVGWKEYLDGRAEAEAKADSGVLRGSAGELGGADGEDGTTHLPEQQGRDDHHAGGSAGPEAGSN